MELIKNVLYIPEGTKLVSLVTPEEDATFLAIFFILFSPFLNEKTI